jgi:hypothetical protein
VTSEEAYATPDACVERLGSSFGGGEPAVVAREPYVAAALEDQEDAISSATAADGDASSELQRLLCRTVQFSNVP